MKQINLFKSKGGSISLPLRSVSRFFMVVMMLFATLHISAQKEKEKRMYATLSNNVATFYYDNMYDDRGNGELEVRLGVTPSDCPNSEKITKVVFDNSLIEKRLISTDSWFYRMSALKEIVGIKNLNTSNLQSMSGMFEGCSSLTHIDVSHFNTSNVTYMDRMFAGCSNLTSIDVSNFNTSKITDMRGMFEGCSSLTSLDVSNFNTSNVTDMVEMFDGCSNLTSLDVSNFSTSNVKYMFSMFEGCSSLTNLDVSNFNTCNVEGIVDMFKGCSSLTSLDVSNFNTSNITDMYGMFYDCNSLTSLDLSSFDTKNVTDMYRMFCGCNSLTNLDVTSFNTSNVTDMKGMFYDCNSLTSLDLSSFDTKNVTDIDIMLNKCLSLESLYFGKNFTQIPSFSDSKNIKRIVSYPKEPNTFSTDYFANEVYENAKLYVPASAKTQYESTDGWKEFKHIMAMNLAPEDDGNKDFGMNDIDENTDLDGNIFKNIFFIIPKEDGGYNADDKSIVLTKAMSDEQMKNIHGLDLFDSYLLENFRGLVFMLDAGNGTIELEAETLRNMQLSVKIGDAEPTTQKVDGKSKVSIPYDVTEPTYVYVYGTTQSAAKATRSANATGDALKLYSIAWGDATGISNINMSADKQATIYNLNGQRVTTPGKGLYIVNGKKVILK